MAYKSKLHEYKLETTYASVWSFRPADIFGRIDDYVHRLHDIKSIFQATNDFYKLDKVEFGGVDGRRLNRRKLIILNEYQMLFNAWCSIDFDPLHSSFNEFQVFKLNYQEKSELLERKLAKIIDEAFDNCYTAEHCLKLLEVIGSLAYRPIIYKQIAHRLNLVFVHYNSNLEMCLDYYEESVSKWKKLDLKVLNESLSDQIKAIFQIYLFSSNSVFPYIVIYHLLLVHCCGFDPFVCAWRM